VQVTISGYVSDALCYDRCITDSSCSKCALDGADILGAPIGHTVHCIRDVDICFNSGYYLATNTGTSGSPAYKPKYLLTDGGTDKVLAWINQGGLSVTAGLKVTIFGDDNGKNELTVINVTECTGNASVCDDVCTGCISTGYIKGTASGIDVDLVRAHAGLLMTAWIYIAPLAWLIKRHQHTPGFPNPKWGKWPIAFLVHGSMMMIVWILTIAGVSIAISEFKMDASRATTAGHLYLGLALFSLTLIQPFPALFCRPAGDSPRRKYFNWFHKSVGALCLILGVVQCYGGVENYKRLWQGKCDSMSRYMAPYLGGLVIFGLTAIVLEVYRQVQFCKGKGVDHGHDATQMDTK